MRRDSFRFGNFGNGCGRHMLEIRMCLSHIHWAIFISKARWRACIWIIQIHHCWPRPHAYGEKAQRQRWLSKCKLSHSQIIGFSKWNRKFGYRKQGEKLLCCNWIRWPTIRIFFGLLQTFFPHVKSNGLISNYSSYFTAYEMHTMNCFCGFLVRN